MADGRHKDACAVVRIRDARLGWQVCLYLTTNLHMGRHPVQFEDPVRILVRICNKLHSLWLAWTYPFAAVGHHLSIHYSCDISRKVAVYIKFGNNVLVGRNSRIDVPVVPAGVGPVIAFDDGCRIGPGATVLGINSIHVGKDVIFGPNVLLMDHNHMFEDVSIPIAYQGISGQGTIRIEDGCWIGFGAAIVCGQEDIVVGRNSVIGANAVITRSVPPYSIVVASPSKVVKHFDRMSGVWRIGSARAPVDQF